MVAPSHVTTGAHPHQPRRWTARTTGSHSVKYSLDPTPAKIRLIQEASRSLGLPLREVGGAGARSGGKSDSVLDVTKRDSVEVWLRTIHEAEFVITDSFHGVVFSILFRRPFVAVANSGRGNARFESLLEVFGLEDHLIAPTSDVDFVDDAIKLLKREINWEDVLTRLSRERHRANDYLRQSIG